VRFCTNPPPSRYGHDEPGVVSVVSSRRVSSSLPSLSLPSADRAYTRKMVSAFGTSRVSERKALLLLSSSEEEGERPSEAMRFQGVARSPSFAPTLFHTARTSQSFPEPAPPPPPPPPMLLAANATTARGKCCSDGKLTEAVKAVEQLLAAPSTTTAKAIASTARSTFIIGAHPKNKISRCCCFEVEEVTSLCTRRSRRRTSTPQTTDRHFKTRRASLI
jgi:hypothetical protein